MEEKEFWVEIPLNAKVTVSVTANNKQEAIQKALSQFDMQIKTTSNLGYCIEEWDIYEKMLQGNFWYGLIYEANSEENTW